MHLPDTHSPDLIQVREITLSTTLAESPWPTIDANLKPVHQPVFLTLSIEHDLRAAGSTDDLQYSVNYSSLCKDAQRACICEEGGGTEMKEKVRAPTAYGLASKVLRTCISGISDAESTASTTVTTSLEVEVVLPKAVLRAKNAYVKARREKKTGKLCSPVRFGIRELPVHCIVGIHPHERETKQPVCFDLDFIYAREPEEGYKFRFSELEKRVASFVEASVYLTVEALASEVARECLSWLEDPNSWNVSITVSKPSALRTAESPVICISRSISDFPDIIERKIEVSKVKSLEDTKTIAALALGANLGDRFQNIELALRYLENPDELRNVTQADVPAGDITIIDTSFLYETAPMYVLDQPSFINCACLIETTLKARDLLTVCKFVEAAVGRVSSVRFGPRAVDVDIITFGDESIDTRVESKRSSLDDLDGELIVPHPRMIEREFVLRPLNDIIPNWIHPNQHLSVRALLSKVVFAKSADEPPMHKVLYFPVSSKLHAPGPLGVPATQTYWRLPDSTLRKTYIMATLNVTPDSFSDGSKHNTQETAITYVRNAVAAGADIIDIGGYSTRPGAAYVSPEEEIERVVPAIKIIREDTDERVRNIPISVDTFRPEVSQAALEAGANCINDVYAFSGPDYPPNSASEKCYGEMRRVVREYVAPAIMMHARGEAGANKDYSRYESMLEGVRVELADKVCRAVRGRGGLRRWQVIVDPGIGFSKTVNGNVELLRDSAKLVENSPVLGLSPSVDDVLSSNVENPYATPDWNPLAGFPVLIGTSRKSYLGKLLAVPRNTAANSPEDVEPPSAEGRDFATAAAVTCAVQQGAAVVRVHEVQGMVDVVKIAEALYS